MLTRTPTLTSHLHPNSHRTRRVRGVLAEQVDAVTFKSFMESPVSTDGALTELTNSLQPTQQCMRNITMCGLSAPRR